jgi:hypothetical protein
LPEADLYIQAANGMTMCLAISLTDYATPGKESTNNQLLTWEGLRAIAQLFGQKQRK